MLFGLDFAVALGILVALALFGASLAPRGRRPATERGQIATWTAAGILAGVAIAIGWTAVSARQAVDLHPRIGSTADLVGEWRDGIDTLTFRGDGTYECRGSWCTGVSPRGTWQRSGNDGIAVQWSDGHRVEWRVVRYRGRYRLALLPSDDDTKQWDGRLFFERVTAAR